jgi:uncharacterized protein (TIGR03083 family)
MSTPEERVNILKAEHHRLDHYLQTLSPEAWHHPSTCDQWTVADVIAHITAFNRNYATWITEALPTLQEQSPSCHAGHDGDHPKYRIIPSSDL